MPNDKPDKPVVKRRMTSITAEQQTLLAAECARRGKTEKAVFDEIVDAGFEAYFERRRRQSAAPAEPPQEASQDVSRAVLAAALWRDYAMFDLMRWVLSALGQDPDDPRYAACGISRYICQHTVNDLDRIWTGVGRRLEEGYAFNPALRMALAEAGADYDAFCGISPAPEKGSARQIPDGGGSSKAKASRKGKGRQDKEKGNGNGSRQQRNDGKR